jgi:formylglycine-generating enzyme required for sulfatase activity
VQWIGGLRAAGSCGSDCNWGWDTGETWGFTNWRLGEPNGGVLEQSLDFYADGTWNDDNGLSLPYIIEWDTDCNSDGIVDYGQILTGALADANSNGIPDTCECATNPGLPSCCIGDIVGDRIINGADLGTLLSYWGPRTSGSFSIASDLNGDGRIDGSDLGMLLSNWGTCPTANVPVWATLLETQPDPAVVTDAALRAAIVATGLPWRVRDTRTGIEMLLVPPGEFQMGCSQGSDTLGCHSWELPVHQATLTSAFYLGRYEVTQAQWSVKMGSNPSYFKFDSDSASRPVEQVSWSTVQSYLAATSLRLPTEAEWEYACRAGTSTPYYNGSTDESTLRTLAWYSQNSGSQTHPVGGRAPNALGLYDMIGNVWEWASDWWGGYPDGSQVNPSGPSNGSTRVRRSSSWRDVEPNVRSSTRPNGGPDQGYDIGFRVARNP